MTEREQAVIKTGLAWARAKDTASQIREEFSAGLHEWRTVHQASEAEDKAEHAHLAALRALLEERCQSARCIGEVTAEVKERE